MVGRVRELVGRRWTGNRPRFLSLVRVGVRVRVEVRVRVRVRVSTGES